MRVAFFETTDRDEAYLKEKLASHDVSFFKEPLTAENALEAASYEIVSVFIYSTITRETLEKMSAVKAILTRSTGFDHIDLAACNERGVAVENVPFYGENTVAEHTFALILALSRNVHKSYARGLKGDFSIDGLMGFDLKDKTLGVVGTGHIGLHVIRIAKGFGMHVLAYDTQKNTFLSEVLHYNYAPLEEVLSQSDIVTLHVPYNTHTHHLINRDNIHHFKKGALLINTARGGIVENEALTEALDQGILSGAGIDVLEGEESIKEENQCLHVDCQTDPKEQGQNQALLTRDNVVYTPHIGFYSEEALHRILDTTIENIECFALGKKKNQVPGNTV
ncbi:MAG: hydroxyacid dehydrogenase [Candidatus Moraniibacteriota bacterium]